jgi:hypothetical protein
LWTFLVDKDLPRSTAVGLREAGHSAFDVQEVGPRGHSDAGVFAFAQSFYQCLLKFFFTICR